MRTLCAITDNDIYATSSFPQICIRIFLCLMLMVAITILYPRNVIASGLVPIMTGDIMIFVPQGNAVITPSTTGIEDPGPAHICEGTLSNVDNFMCTYLTQDINYNASYHNNNQPIFIITCQNCPYGQHTWEPGYGPDGLLEYFIDKDQFVGYDNNGAPVFQDVRRYVPWRNIYSKPECYGWIIGTVNPPECNGIQRSELLGFGTDTYGPDADDPTDNLNFSQTDLLYLLQTLNALESKPDYITVQSHSVVVGLSSPDLSRFGEARVAYPNESQTYILAVISSETIIEPGADVQYPGFWVGADEFFSRLQLHADVSGKPTYGVYVPPLPPIVAYNDPINQYVMEKATNYAKPMLYILNSLNISVNNYDSRVIGKSANSTLALELAGQFPTMHVELMAPVIYQLGNTEFMANVDLAVNPVRAGCGNIDGIVATFHTCGYDLDIFGNIYNIGGGSDFLQRFFDPTSNLFGDIYQGENHDLWDLEYQMYP